MSGSYDDFRDEYVEFLTARGTSLYAFGVHEHALTRDDALLAVALARRRSVPVLGGDVWVRRGAELRLTYDNWYCDPRPGEGVADYFARSWTTAEDYIARFPNPPDGEALFVVVLPGAVP